MGAVERRVGLLFAIFLLLLGAAGARAAYFGTVKGGSLSRVAATQQAVDVHVPARRGTITDHKGVELAVSESAADVSATPYLVRAPGAVARTLSPLLHLPVATLVDKLTRRDTGFAYLARGVPGDVGKRIENLEIEGIDVLPTTRRSYPRAWLASQILGVVGTDGKGLGGIEYSDDSRLRGHDGERLLTRDARGDPISLRDVRRARAGKDLELTIDAAIQEQTEKVLQGVGERFRPRGATAIVMDPRTSAILAAANWPLVDANAPGGAPAFAREDRAVGASYEPGSTFKAFTVAGALEGGLVTPQTTFNLAPQIQVADRTIGESHERGPATLSTAQILAQSSNVGAITIGLRLGKDRFDTWVRRFGFGKPTSVDLPGEAGGIVPKVQDYSGSSMGNLPIGQGLAVTPMQMASAYAAIANGGVLRPPHVVSAVGGRREPTPKGHRIISIGTARELRTMLEGVLAPGGTAAEAAIPGYALAGKTGTANKPDPTTGGYSDTKYVASFTGFAPARKPRLLVAVMVDEPKGEIYGGLVAAPAFKEIARFALPYLRIPPG